MNDHEIEKLLRKTQDLPPPPELLENLLADIPHRQTPAGVNQSAASWLWLRRWVPATACMGIGVFVLVVQAGAAIKLRREIQASGPAVENLDQLRQSNSEYKRLLLENKELEKLREEYLEAVALRDEFAQLKIQFAEVNRLRAENANLRSLLPTLAAEDDAIEEASTLILQANEKATRIQCLNNLKHIGLAMHVWASKHNNELPASWDEIREELQAPRIVICPSDADRKQYLEFELNNMEQDMTSYKFYLPGNQQERIDPMQIIAKCIVHGSFCLGDGSARHDLGDGKEVMINGRLTYVRSKTPRTTQ